MDKTLNYLGLAKRSRHLIFGTDQVIKTLQSHNGHLIVLASDASNGTKDKIIKKAFFYNVPVLDIYSSEEIASATGQRNPIVSIIDDPGFAEAIIKDQALDGKKVNYES